MPLKPSSLVPAQLTALIESYSNIGSESFVDATGSEASIATETGMSTIDDRKRALENKFAHDQDLKFKAESRRNRLLAEWLAPKLGREDHEAYAKEIIEADLKQAGDGDVFAKALADIGAAGASVTEDELRAKMDELLATAAEQVANA